MKLDTFNSDNLTVIIEHWNLRQTQFANSVRKLNSNTQFENTSRTLNSKIILKTNTDNRTEERRNRFKGESIMLTKQKAAIHDRIFIDEIAATIEDKTLGQGASKHWQKMRKGLDWFIKNNAKAYMVLLD